MGEEIEVLWGEETRKVHNYSADITHHDGDGIEEMESYVKDARSVLGGSAGPNRRSRVQPCTQGHF